MDDFNIDGLFGVLLDQLPDGWLDHVQDCYGADLTEDDISQSVLQASEFFNLGAPMELREGWTTGVFKGMPFTENDDILIFNRRQLLDMGISDKEGFDLVMTHEGAHRALQGMDLGFDSYQEELCCDYMAGIRAGLNGLDENKMESSLAETINSDTHPDGALRVHAIEQGVAFANDYMAEHNGVPPTFSECLEHFEKLDLFASVSGYAGEQINLSPEGVGQDNPLESNKDDFGSTNGTFGNDSYSHGTNEKPAAFVNDKSYHLNEAETAKKNAEWHHKRANEAIAKGDLSLARDHESSASMYERRYHDHLDAVGKCTQFANNNPEDLNRQDIAFEGNYSKEEIDHLRRKVDSTEYEMKCRKNDVSLLESKVSLLKNNQRAHDNGEYYQMLDRLNEAKSRLSRAQEAYKDAKSKLNNAL